jgi:hypothetical protein
MKKFSRILIIFLLFCISPILVSNAAEFNPNDYYKETSRETTKLYRDIYYDTIIAETRTDRPSGSIAGYGSTGNINPNTWYGQQINVLNVPRSNGARVIPWSVQNDLQWDMMSITAMAQDFERKNPGWVVLGGVNGDFYDWHNTKDYGQSGSGMEIVEGNMLRYYASGWNAVGFTNDDSKDQITYINGSKVTRTEKPVLYIYDNNNNLLKSLMVDKFNEEISENETGVYFGRITGEKGVNQYGENTYLTREYVAPTLGTGNTYIVEKASKVIFQADDNSYYGYGTISSVDSSVTVPKTGFAVVSNNQEINNLLNIGTTIKVQYELTGEYSNIQNAIGAKMDLITDGVLPAYSTDSYETIRAPRTIVGQKDDGTICLLTMDGRQQYKNMYGTNQQEFNAFMKYYGISDAVLLDGGGSSTFFVRENNKFVIKNSPSDSSDPEQPRNVGNCLLVIVPLGEFSISSTTILSDSITFNIDTTNTDLDYITNIKCTFNGVTKNVVDNKVTFDGLTNNTEYKYAFTYDTLDKKDVETMIAGTIHSAKLAPTFGDLKIEVGTNKLIFTPSITDPDFTLNYYRIFINNRREPFLDEPIEVKIDLTGLEKITFDVLISYDLNDGIGKVEKTESYIYDILTGTLKSANSSTDPEPNPSDDEKSGCKKDASMVIISLISLSSLLVLIKKRK